METQVEVILAIGGLSPREKNTARLVATAHCDGSADRWSGEARLHVDSRTGRIWLGQLVVPGEAPWDVVSALRSGIERAWHHGGDVLVHGADGQGLNEAQVVAQLRHWATPPRSRQVH